MFLERNGILSKDSCLNLDMNQLVSQNLHAIDSLCKKHKVEKLYAFGSVVTSEFSDASDIDLLVKFQPTELLHYPDNYFDLKFSLEEIFKRDVDLLEEQAIKNPYLLKSINSGKQLIYG